MTRPDLDGLRLTLLDGESSLRTARQGDPHDPNERQAARSIESVSVEASKIHGVAVSDPAGCNPWLNVIIGGLGTGKSTLVDFASRLCSQALRRGREHDEVDLTEDGALRSLFDRRMRVASRRDLEGLLTRDTKIGQSRVEFKGGLQESDRPGRGVPG